MVEFEKWETPFSAGGIFMVSVVWGQGPTELSSSHPPRRFRCNSDQPKETPALTACIFSFDQERLYSLSFEVVSGFRVLDEHGLTEIWGAEDYDSQVLGNCFRVRNHSWHKESPVTFLFGMPGEWSYLVTTLEDCLEVVSGSEPKIVDLGEVSPD